MRLISERNRRKAHVSCPGSILFILILMVAVVSALSGCDKSGDVQDSLLQDMAGLPVISISLPEDDYKKFLASRDHSDKAYGGTFQINLPPEYESEFGPIDLSGIGRDISVDYIRGRGNSTWLDDKRSFKLKLDEGADLLGMGKSKHWVLLANSYDTSLLRNLLVLYMGRSLGLDYTPRQLPVELCINGDFTGTYTFGQNVRIGQSEVDIDEINPSLIKEPDISGGYILATSPYPNEPEDNIVETRRGIRFKTEEPAFAKEESDEQARARQQKEYIMKYLQDTEDAIFGQDCKNGMGVSYENYMDLESAATFWWIQEFIANADAFRSPSTYLYKKRNGKLYWGPLWDFDIAMNPAMYEDTLDNTHMAWLDHLRAYDKHYQDALRKTWGKMVPVLEEMIRDGGVIDRYADQIRRSWIRNNEKWNLSGDADQCFETQILELKEFIKGRRYAIAGNLSQMISHVDMPDTAIKEKSEQSVYSKEEDLSFIKETDMAGGICGSCRWVIDRNGRMVISPIDGQSGDLAEWTNPAERPWSKYLHKITEISIQGNVRAKTCLAMFYGCYYTTHIDLSGLDTSQVEVFRAMFAWCHSLKKLDLCELDTSKAVTTREMFLHCDSLTEINLSGLDLSGAVTMRSMFGNCGLLSSIEMAKADKGMVTDLSGMFSGCKALKNIDLRNLDTSAVTSMRSMFYHCRSLSRLDLSRFDIAKVQDMSFMFAGCENLEKLEPCKTVPDREVRKNCIFLFCPKLKEQQIYQQ